jgi:hypothetical protein
MTNFFRAAAVGVAVSLAGCAIHPLPEDVTGVSTFKIAQKIRCEARGALRDNLIRWLLNAKHDPAAMELGAQLQDGTLTLDAFAKNFNGYTGKLTPRLKANIQKFRDTAIAYDFSFNMTETNNVDPTLDLTKPLSSRTYGASITGGVDRTRQNIREFTITDTFARLFIEVREKYCSEIADGKNYLYPITGNIGIDEMIGTFVRLSLFADLSGQVDEVDVANQKGPPTMADTITFSTTLKGSVTPEVVLTPVGSAIQIADASLGLTAARTDVHKVIVALALPPPTSKGAAGPNALGPQPLGSRPAPLLINANANATPAEQVAAHTIEQIITRFELGQSGVAVIPNQ